MGASTPDGFFAIAGCMAPHNSSDRMCGASTTYVHINVEAWSGGYQTLLAQMEADMPFMAPKSLGPMGYEGLVSMYIPERVKTAAYNADAEALEYFRSYNASRKHVWRYFNSPRDVETSRLRPCVETTLTDSARMKEYAEISGDTEGVVVKGNLTEGRVLIATSGMLPHVAKIQPHAWCCSPEEMDGGCLSSCRKPQLMICLWGSPLQQPGATTRRCHKTIPASLIGGSRTPHIWP